MEFLKEVYEYGRSLQFSRVGDTLIVLLMVAAYYYVYRTKDVVFKQAVVFPSIFYAAAILNPISSYILSFKLGFSSRMGRFLWMFPAALILGYVAIELLDKLSSAWKKILLSVFFVVITFFTQNSNDISYATENIYKVSDELLVVSELLHEASDAEKVVVFFEDWNLWATVRQYDSWIRITRYRDMILSQLEAFKKSETQEDYQTFLEMMERWRVDYLVLYQDTTVFSEKEEVEYVAETEQFKIYRIKWKQE